MKAEKKIKQLLESMKVTRDLAEETADLTAGIAEEQQAAETNCACEEESYGAITSMVGALFVMLDMSMDAIARRASYVVEHDSIHALGDKADKIRQAFADGLASGRSAVDIAAELNREMDDEAKSEVH